jgi:hypothetical protein
MSMLSLLRERLGQPARDTEEFRVSYGSPARYRLQIEPGFVKSISAIRALVKRHVHLSVAKRQVEQMLLGDEVAIDLPMLEDATAFESELHELGIIAVREAPAAAAEG